MVSIHHLQLLGAVCDRENGINLNLFSGEILVVLGENGSGKSTLINYLAGVHRPKPGVIFIEGADMANDANRAKARERIGTVFEEPALLRSANVADNIAMPIRFLLQDREANVRTQVCSLLDLVGAGQIGHLMPATLSDGLSKSVALARALAGNKSLLFCDEPTAGMSPARAWQAGELIKALVSQRYLQGAIICTQDLELAEAVGSRFAILEARVSGSPDLSFHDCWSDLIASRPYRRFMKTPSLEPVSESLTSINP